MRIKELTLDEMKMINKIFDGTSKIKILPKKDVTRETIKKKKGGRKT